MNFPKLHLFQNFSILSVSRILFKALQNLSFLLFGVFAVTLVSTSSSAYAQEAGPQKRVRNTPTGLLIPMYIYPGNVYSNPTYNLLIDLKKQYHQVPVTAIINPGNGPGTVTDGNYRVAIDRLHGAGISVLGYIHTSYTGRSLDSVKADVAKWKTLYPAIDGIFFDEMTNDHNASHVSYYSQLTQYIHDQGLYPSIGNPGAGILPNYFDANAADIIVVHENNHWPSEVALKGDYDRGYVAYPYDQRAGMVYGVEELDYEKLQVFQKYLGMIYVTEATGTPWGTLTGHLEGLMRFLSNPLYDVFYVSDDKKVGLGTTSPPYELAVDGTIGAREIIVEPDTWSDFVFEEDYPLPSLGSVERHIEEHQHLPGIPSAKEVSEQGIEIGEMQAKLLQKVEELTLYAIEQQKQLQNQKALLSQQAEQIQQLSQQVSSSSN